MIEEWKDIEGFDNYIVSNLGNVLNKRKNTFLKPYKEKKGYLRVRLCKNGKYKHFLIHRLVAEAFIPNTDNKPFIDHINTIKNDNRVENLRWVTNKENCNNPLTIEKYKEINKIKNKQGKLSPKSKPTLQFDLNGNFIRKWDCIKDIERELGFDDSHISDCCLEKKYYKTAYGYKWGYESDYELIPFKVFDLKIYRKKVA